MRRPRGSRLLVALVALVLLAPAARAEAITVWAVGDGAVDGTEDRELAERVEAAGLDRFLYLGDVYETGTARDFAERYHPSWGRFKSVTYPTPGNHEWGNRAQGYDPYWGARVRQPGAGYYYSRNLPDGWRVISLNGMESMSSSSPQARWLRADLARYRGSCTIAFLHHPRYSAGTDHGNTPAVEPLWAALVGRAAVVLAGHDHDYQRLRPNRGLVQFVVGSGGRRPIDPVNRSDSRLAYANDQELGALRMILSEGRLDHAFMAADGSFEDGGSISCTPVTPVPGGSLEIRKPRHGAVHSRGVRSFKGKGAGVTGPVRVTIRRHARGRCSYWTGSRLKPSSCSTRSGVNATGVAAWKYTPASGRALPRGSYKMIARATGENGRTVSDSVRFRIR